MKYRIGDRTEVVEQGARVQIPRGTVHGFTNVGSATARHILVSTPRRHEEFFRNLHNISQEGHMNLLPEIAARHDQVIVGSLP